MNSQYRFTEQVGYLLRRAYQRHLAIFHARTGDLQLTSVQFSTLCALRDAPSLSQHELVKATGVDQATIRGIVDRLQKRGLVSFAKDPADARKVLYAVTEAGLDALTAMIPRAVEISEETFGSLNPAERMALMFALAKMIGEDAPDWPAPRERVNPPEGRHEDGDGGDRDPGQRPRPRGPRAR
ncbi:MAG: winged helix-turn-helix transcriptional regulator [Parafilimonas terrae]|nr:winged helix-turn-helix transcriptional regulator [Parafilimonas terrae]